MVLTFKPLGMTQAELEQMKSSGLRLDKRQQKAMLAGVEAPRPSSAQIDSFEHKLKIKLPTDYREFLRTQNGGRPHPSVMQILGDDSRTTTVAQIFALTHPVATCTVSNRLEVYNGRIPVSCIPIASDPAGNLFLIELASPNHGHVLFWDHEREVETDAQADYSNTYPVANSFTEFLQSLHSE